MYEKIKKLCRDKDISVYRLEKDLELSTGSVSKWDKSIPRGDTLIKIAEYFGVPVECLLDMKRS